MKDQIEGASVLKHVEATKDTSAPKIEPGTQVKKVDRKELVSGVEKPQQLKHVEDKKDTSAPKIEPGVQVKTRPLMERNMFLSSVEKAVAATPIDKAVKSVETSLRMIDAAQKSVQNNKQNLTDSENKAPGAPTVEEAKKMLATAEDLLSVQIKNAQVRFNAAANELDRSRSQATPELLSRWESARAALKNHGLSVI